MTPAKITIFNGQGNDKVPMSKNEDGTFIFITKEFETLKEAANLMFQHFSLSKPINTPPEGIHKKRNKSELDPYIPNKIYNIAIDLDEISNKDDYFDVIEYFQNKDYSVLLGKSKSWDGKEVFNLKGILRVNLTNNPEIIKAALTQMQTELGEKCKVDLTVANTVSLQAPSKNDFIVYYQEKGKVLKESDIHIEEIKQVIQIERPEIRYDNEIVDKSLEIFWSLGYSMMARTPNDNGSINFRHPGEKKSPGGFFWFASNPFVMNHHVKEKSVSIFQLIKDTPEGKRFLKNKTREEQRRQLIKSQNMINYKQAIIVDERYLDFTKQDKIDMIDDWMNTDQGVLKIKSAMGSAKSSGIDLVIQKAHERKEKVILVSNRVSVAQDFADKYNLMWYKDPESIDSDESLVVQWDSLHKYNLSKYDIVIFDEFVSLLLHHRAGLTKNTNINAVKFKILLENKRTVIADAFLTGYEDTFFLKRDIFAIINEYKDDVKLFEYKNKEFFVSSIIDKAVHLEKGEHISCSFASVNVMRVVEMELKRKGIKVITLSAETSELTRDIIYKRFKEDTHSAFQVILFTPTLTVGVSNLNNTPYHFHFDNGMSTDVVSSLQMIKRSRTTREIHYYLEERQFYYDTDYDSLNNLAEKSIQAFFNNKDKTLLVDVDYTTGELSLTPLAKYINQIEVFYNVLENNHANAFKLLLSYQFENEAEIIEEEDESFSIKQKIKEVKEQLKKDTIEILNKYSDVTWTSVEIDEIKAKSSDKTEEDKAKLLMGEIQQKFKKSIPKDKLLKLAMIEIEKDYKFISQIKNMNMVLNNKDDYISYLISDAISNDISSLQNKTHIEFLEYLLGFNNGEKLKQSYSRREILDFDKEQGKGKKFEKFLKKIGYSWGEARCRIDPIIFDYLEYL